MGEGEYMEQLQSCDFGAIEWFGTMVEHNWLITSIPDYLIG